MSCPHLNLTNIRVKQRHATSCIVNEEISGDDIQWKARKRVWFASVDIIGKLAKMVNPDPSASLAVVNQ
jgi:hypothetical protein